MNTTTNQDLDGIAIIGLVSKFPGPENVEQLWQNLCRGVKLIDFFEDGALDSSIDRYLSQDPSYVQARGIITNAEFSDTAFVGINLCEAEGTVFSNGGGLVVLKRLNEAVAAGDKIYAVIRSVGVNHDEADQVSFSAPSVDGQAEAIAMAQAYANFQPKTISVGVGGTNVHLVLAEAPLVPTASPSRSQQLLLLSAKTSTALATATTNLQTHLKSNPDINLADVAYTLRHGRKEFNYRSCVVCQDPADAVQALSSDSSQMYSRQLASQNPAVVFMFPGQGSQYVNMGVSFYHDEPVFKASVDHCANLLEPLLGLDLRSILYPAAADVEAATISLAQAGFTHLALFVVEYALAQLWQSWGVIPQATIGHSIGEFVSACVSGVLSLEDALLLVAKRSRLIGDLPTGSMLSVRLPAAEIAAQLSGDLTIAAINGPSLCVIAGFTAQIEILQAQLTAQGIVCRLLHTSHAFHSSMMDSIIDPFADLVRQVKLSPPQIPFVSTVTGDWITDMQATDPLYWATQIRHPVRFAAGIQTLWQHPGRVLLEVGPRTTTATLARQQAQDLQRQIAISTLNDAPEHEWKALLQAVGQLWVAGVDIHWDNFEGDKTRRRIPLPTYPFEQQQFWIDPLPPLNQNGSSLSIVNPSLFSHPPAPMKIAASLPLDPNKSLITVLKEIFAATSGLEMIHVAESTTFLEMGLDSLSLTQIGIALKQKFQVKITLRQLLELYPTFNTLADFLMMTLPVEELPVDTSGSNPTITPNITPQSADSSVLETVINQQLQLMAQQLALLSQNRSRSIAAPAPVISTENASLQQNIESKPPTVVSAVAAQTAQSRELLRSRIELPNAAKNQPKTLTDSQRAGLAKIIERYTQRTQKSKQFAGVHRSYLADPRTVSGFNPTIKEMVYPMVVDQSSGSKLWDIDGNEYIDLVSGFGLNLFGWSPAFVTEAITTQLQLGMEIGPQSPLAGDVARLICEMTGFDRATFCNTGSEALLGAIRLAQTVTGRDLVAIFAGSEHGIVDEVVVRGTGQLRSIQAAPGIPPEMVANILVIDDDAPDVLEILKSRADQLAAVIVEPVQSRSPEYQPRELLHKLRDFTQQAGVALIFDEVVTGFRIHPGGAQAHFGVKADIATYGQIVGGGLPIGVIAGTSTYMDALDGGGWQFGDDSMPAVGVDHCVGTLLTHPLALAAAKAVLTHLKQSGAILQQQLNTKTDRLVAELTACFQQMDTPFTVHNFGSLFIIKYPPNFLAGDLLFYLLRLQGIHIYDYCPCFLTTAHTDADLDLVMTAFKASISELQAHGFLALSTPVSSQLLASKHELNVHQHQPVAVASTPNHPPKSGAKLGRDRQGNPAWFIADPDRAGKYLQIANHE